MATTLTNSPADEDNGQGQPNTADSGPLPSASTATATGQGGTTGGTGNVAQGSDGQATSNTTTFVTNSESPGKRLKNPLGFLSSYTYQLSLYMVTPDAYAAFTASGRRNLNLFNNATAGQAGAGGAFLIAQSGGVNDSSKRAPGFEFDFGIDNLTFITMTSGNGESLSTNTQDIRFQITEPYGFSFLTKLRNASDAIRGYNQQLGEAYRDPLSPENPMREIFILGIKFFGYDESGNIVTGSEVFNGDVLDPNSSGNGLFETYYEIQINNVKFKLEGKSTVYNIEAASLGAMVGFSVKRGLVRSSGQLEAATVGEAIDQLLEKLNKNQLDMQKNNTIKYANTYKVVYLNDAKLIAEASMVSEEDLSKLKYPSAGVKNVNESNDAAGVNAKPNVTKKTIAYNLDDPILNVFDSIIANSSFLRDALKVVYTTATEPAKTGGVEENKPTSKQKIQWYNCSADISNARWDDNIGDWAYDITYVIQTYQTPVIDSIYAKPGEQYYGPHKRYQYWYGDNNSEVLGYTQNYDNTYFTVAVADAAADTEATTITPVRPGQRTNRPRLGKLNNGLEAQNSYLTSLYDPNATSTADISILGDPDFLMQTQTSSIDTVYNRFYGGDGFTVNANGGQVFVEIDFNEAVDYESEKGVMKLNDSILFYKYPESVAKQVQGVSYRLVTVRSSFSNGSFRQVLTGFINDFGMLAGAGEVDDTGSAPDDDTATTNSTGFSLLKRENSTPAKPGARMYSDLIAPPSYIPQPVTVPATATPGAGTVIARDPAVGTAIYSSLTAAPSYIPQPVADDDGNG